MKRQVQVGVGLCFALIAASCTTRLPSITDGTKEPGAGNSSPPSVTTPVNACVSVGEWKAIPADRVAGEPTVAAFGIRSDAFYATAADGGLWRYQLGVDVKREKVGKERYQAFRPSPDGTSIAGIVNHKLWLLDVASGAERSLSTEAYGVLAWKSDGTSVFIAGERDSKFGVAEVQLETEAIRWWITTHSGTKLLDPSRGLVQEIDTLMDRPHPEGSLSKDDRQLLFSTGHSGVGTIYRLDLVAAQAYAYHETRGDGFSARWLPDGNHAIFGWGPIFVLNVSTGETRPVDLPVAAVTVQDVSADGVLLLLSQQDDESVCWMVGPAPEPPKRS